MAHFYFSYYSFSGHLIVFCLLKNSTATDFGAGFAILVTTLKNIITEQFQDWFKMFYLMFVKMFVKKWGGA